MLSDQPIFMVHSCPLDDIRMSLVRDAVRFEVESLTIKRSGHLSRIATQLTSVWLNVVDAEMAYLVGLEPINPVHRTPSVLVRHERPVLRADLGMLRAILQEDGDSLSRGDRDAPHAGNNSASRVAARSGSRPLNGTRPECSSPGPRIAE